MARDASQEDDTIEIETELASLTQQRDNTRESLRLIELRESEFVLPSEIPLQLIRDKEVLQERLREIEQRITNLADPRIGLSGPRPTTAHREAKPYEVLAPDRIVWVKDDKEMVDVPAGKFLYGDKKEERELPEFWIDKAPVTNAEYAQFVVATDHRLPDYWESKTPPKKTADDPVVYVTWHDAEAYAEWAGKRLPTEEEWEKAARGTDGRVYPWGDWEPGRCNVEETGIHSATPVGQFSPGGDSPYGCVDMAGNVWEWTASAWKRGSDYRVVRGGSWRYTLKRARCAYRLSDNPYNSHRDHGLRCVFDES